VQSLAWLLTHLQLSSHACHTFHPLLSVNPLGFLIFMRNTHGRLPPPGIRLKTGVPVMSFNNDANPFNPAQATLRLPRHVSAEEHGAGKTKK
jgi:hypothetical protein